MNAGEPLLDLLDTVKKELECELQTEANGAQLRARIQWAEDGEASTAFFLQQEKSRSKQRLIYRIKRPNGTIASETLDIIPVYTLNCTPLKMLIHHLRTFC